MSRPKMRVLCVFGPLHDRAMDVDRWSFAADATPAENIYDFDPSAPVVPKIVYYTVQQIRHADFTHRALVAVLDGHTLSPTDMERCYGRAVRAGCVEPETP